MLFREQFCVFFGNGGALLVSNSNVSLTESDLIENQAFLGGGQENLASGAFFSRDAVVTSTQHCCSWYSVFLSRVGLSGIAVCGQFVFFGGVLAKQNLRMSNCDFRYGQYILNAPLLELLSAGVIQNSTFAKSDTGHFDWDFKATL